MKKILLFVFAFVHAFLFAEDETELEKLWRMAAMNNRNVLAAVYDKSVVENELAYFWQKRIPLVSFSASSSFLQFENTGMDWPQKISSSISIRENFAGGLCVYFVPSLAFSKGADEKSGLVYSDAENFDVIVSQSLNPFWLQKKTRDPEKESLDFERKILAAQVDVEIFECMENVASCFIKYRQYCRLLDSLEKTIGLYEELIDAWNELKRLDKASVADVYSVRENLFTYEEDFYEYFVAKKGIESELRILLGMDGNETDLFEKIDFLGKLPELGEKIFTKNPELVLWELMKKKNESDYVLEKQNSAPILSLSGTIPIHEKERDYVTNMIYSAKSKTWSAGIEIDFSPLLGKNKVQTKKNFEWAENEYNRRFLQKQKDLKREKDYYEKLVAACEEQLDAVDEIRKNKAEILAAVEELYKQQGCSKIELLNAKINSCAKENDYYVQLDSLWLYKWLLQNRDK